MAEERKYREDEVRKIFALATSADSSSLPALADQEGLTLGELQDVGRVVELPREATDREWQFLVAELREAFDAKGEVTAHGEVREWTNGNLHAVLEQTEAGHRIRLGTRKGNATEIALSGLVGLLMGLFLFSVMVMAGKTGAEFFIPTLFVLAGGGVLASNSPTRLPFGCRSSALRTRASLACPLPTPKPRLSPTRCR